MKLAAAIADVDQATVMGDDQVDIAAVTYDSRRVSPGSLFCCLVGAQLDGHDFAADAVARGAVAVLVERALPDTAVPREVTQVLVAATRPAMASIAAACNGHPSRTLTVIGVTGTNGKTTTVHLLANVFRAAGRRVEVLGTLSGERTTPESPDLQSTLAGWRDEGVEVVAMEVSSHALVLHRVDATRFRAAVFTNLGRDHLDFHHTMESYFDAKAQLFQPDFTDLAVVNLDSPHGRLLADSASVPTVGYRLDDLTGVAVRADHSELTWRGQRVRLPLGGSFNLSNALAAAETGRALGLDDAVVAAGLARPLTVPGRFEVVTPGPPFAVVVDYAHTPDALERLLESAAEVAPTGQVTVVFGCGGDRDRTKRPAMGEVAARRADRVVLTADNSRGEETGAIIEAVRRGFERTSPRRARTLVVEPDRRAAIGRALAAARSGDVVLIAGKGHEQTLTIGEDVVPFDDRVVARQLLAQRGGTP
jgi:UDP-N-acetylmuramoyl-L-alanyl-D-glutamate--2,6-diaminopimelate ligase